MNMKFKNKILLLGTVCLHLDLNSNFPSSPVRQALGFTSCHALSSTPRTHRTTKLFNLMMQRVKPRRQDDMYASSNTSKMTSSSSNNNTDQTSIASVKKKQLYLLTDDGFLYKILLNLLTISLLFTITLSFPRLQQPAVQLYNSLTDRMLVIAHRNAWWFILATLSSSCCVLQLLLNALSVGCAGFNTVLGPLRPTFLAIGILSQGMSWYVMLRMTGRPQWGVTVGSSCVMVVLSLLPEILAIYTSWRKRIIDGNVIKKESVVSDHNTNTIPLVFDMGTSVGCSACVKNISETLDKMSAVSEFDVSVDDNKLNIRCKVGTDPAIILEKLKDRGYPMKAME